MDKMVAEFRFKKLENEVQGLNRRVTDHDSLHETTAKLRAEDRKDIDMLQKILSENQKILAENQKTNELISMGVDYARKTYEVFEPLARIGTKIVKFGTFFTIIYHGLKFLIPAKFTIGPL